MTTKRLTHLFQGDVNYPPLQYSKYPSRFGLFTVEAVFKSDMVAWEEWYSLRQKECLIKMEVELFDPVEMQEIVNAARLRPTGKAAQKAWDMSATTVRKVRRGLSRINPPGATEMGQIEAALGLICQPAPAGGGPDSDLVKVIAARKWARLEHARAMAVHNVLTQCEPMFARQTNCVLLAVCHAANAAADLNTADSATIKNHLRLVLAHTHYLCEIAQFYGWRCTMPLHVLTSMRNLESHCFDFAFVDDDAPRKSLWRHATAAIAFAASIGASQLPEPLRLQHQSVPPSFPNHFGGPRCSSSLAAHSRLRPGGRTPRRPYSPPSRLCWNSGRTTCLRSLGKSGT